MTKTPTCCVCGSFTAKLFEGYSYPALRPLHYCVNEDACLARKEANFQKDMEEVMIDLQEVLDEEEAYEMQANSK